MRNAVILLLLATVAVSAQSKQRVAVLPSIGDLDPQRLILLTDKVREIATKNLPRDNFNILKQDVITKMIGEEELYRSCKEGVCIGDLARKTNANYGARCDVVKLDNSLVLKFELYSVNEDAIFETFTDYDTKDFRGMLAVLEARLPDVFKEMVNVSDRALADDRDKTREQQRQETKAQVAEEYKPTPTPEPVVPVPPPAAVSLAEPEPVKPEPAPIVALVAPPRKIAPTPDVAKKTNTRRKTSPAVVTLRIVGAAAAAGGFIGGLVVNGDVKDALNEYNADRYSKEKVTNTRKDIDGKITLRNTMYTVAGVGLTGFTVMLCF